MNNENKNEKTHKSAKQIFYIYLGCFIFGISLYIWGNLIDNITILHAIDTLFSWDLFILLFISIPIIIYQIYYLFYCIIKKENILRSIIYSTLSIIIFLSTYAFFKIIIIENINNQWADKPIIYIYPKEDDTNIDIKLSNKELITHSYPKYNNSWNVIVDKDGTIYDKDTNKNYYALYWEGIDNSKINTNEGYVIKGSDTTKFLEEKLEILGLNEREINEFIIYWLPKMENNKYNYIRFRTTEEINKYMKLETDVEIDTLIRVFMDFKPLDKKINIKEQKLNKVTREGFTIVEWGGRELK